MALAGRHWRRLGIKKPTEKYDFYDQTTAVVQGSSQEEARAIILTATQAEYNAVCFHLKDIKPYPCNDDQFYGDVEDYYKGEFDDANGTLWHVIVAKTESRNVAASIEAGKTIHCFNPEIILFVGTAGGIKTKDLKIGYVVVADMARNVDYGHENPKFCFFSTFVPEARVERSDANVLRIAVHCSSQNLWKERIEDKTCQQEPQVLIGPVATTSRTIKTRRSQTFRIIRKYYGGDTLALEQEGYGFLQAGRSANTPAIVIRGIADLIKGKDKAEKKGSKECAMMSASAFAFELIANYSYLLPE
jgi:nucleoside phosphorylase